MLCARLLFIAVSLIVVASSTATTLSVRKVPPFHSEPAYTIVFSIPVGDEGLHYQGLAEEELEAWGPASFRVLADGGFLITDSVAGRILEFDRTGARVGAVSLTNVVGITDAIKEGERFVVLDAAAVEPAIITVSREGKQIDRLTLPSNIRRLGLSGITRGEGGRVLVELFSGRSTATPSGQPARSLASAGRELRITSPPTNSPLFRSEANVEIDGKKTTVVRVKGDLGGISVLASRPEGDFFLLVEELIDGDSVQVRQTVQHFSSDGKLLGAALVPLEERVTYVNHGVDVGPDKQVYALLLKPDRALVVRLRLEANLNLGERAPASASLAATSSPIQPAETCRTRAQMTQTAEGYIQSSAHLSDLNLNGSCTFRQKPTYLGTTSGVYPSVPYDWGGFDSVVDYQKFMADSTSHFRAGDRKEPTEARTDEAACSKGVDCSGFVSRCWGLNQKESTSSLPNISTVIPRNSLLSGDILNRAGKHVVLFDKTGADPNGGPNQGLFVWEATQTFKYDRVVYSWWPWSRFNKYVPRKYRSVC